MNYYYQYSSTSPALTSGVTASPTQNLPSASGSLQAVNPYTVTGLTSETRYWFRLVAVSGGVTRYGPIKNFNTGSLVVTAISTKPPTNANSPVLYSATLNGNYTYAPNTTGVWYFEYSLDQAVTNGITRVPPQGLPINSSGTSQSVTYTLNNLPPRQVRKIGC